MTNQEQSVEPAEQAAITTQEESFRESELKNPIGNPTSAIGIA